MAQYAVQTESLAYFSGGWTATGTKIVEAAIIYAAD